MNKDYSFAILAPAIEGPLTTFGRTSIDSKQHAHLLSSIQSLRGELYLQDCAICAADLDEQNRFRMRGDECAWHLILLDQFGKVAGCVRYLQHSNSCDFHELNVADSAIARHPVWGERVRQAVKSDLDLALKEHLEYVEVGGWALRDDLRNTRAAYELLIASYALGSLWGGSIGHCTATARHSSSSMLRRLGGKSFIHDGDIIPAYYDPRYGCQMELLRFDYRFPAPRFASAIPLLIGTLSNSPVLMTDIAPEVDKTHSVLTQDLLQLSMVTTTSLEMSCPTI